MKYLILFLISFSSFAESYLIEGTLVSVTEKEGLKLSSCVKECDALKAVAAHKRISMKAIGKDIKFAGSVGSEVCHEVYKAQSLLGRNSETKDQRAFCLFPDKSMIEINSLSDYLTKNKYVY
ncbi:MAG: hypothetical protein V4598_06800 [Bdellovibrionota bacterium]